MKRIKFISVFVVVIALFSFNSCDNEPLEGEFSNSVNNGGNNNNGNGNGNNNGGNNSEDIVGEWTTISFNANTIATTTFNGVAIVSDSDITGQNLNYNITFTNSQFQTSGSYDARVITEVDGNVISDDTSSYTNVSGSGDYTTNGNIMNLNGSFFELEIDGVDTSSFEENQTLTFQLSSDGQRLTFTQNEERTENQMGIETVINIIGTTVLERL